MDAAAIKNRVNVIPAGSGPSNRLRSCRGRLCQRTTEGAAPVDVHPRARAPKLAERNGCDLPSSKRSMTESRSISVVVSAITAVCS
jgi:hypothetical protein